MATTQKSNKPKLYKFKGDHEYFQDGTGYTIRAYSIWTSESAGPGVSFDTMKGRLHGNKFCEPKHLLPSFQYKANGAKRLRGFAKASKLKEKLNSRFESQAETLSGRWLKVTL